MSAVKNLSEIMQEENSAVAVTDLNLWILDKIKSQGYENLSTEEKVIIHINALDWELFNHGVNRLIFGSEINFSVEMTECLRRVGAHKTAELFDELLSLIPKLPLPEDKDERKAYFMGLKDETVDRLGLGIQKLFDGREELFDLVCGYFDSVRQRLAGQAPHSQASS